MKFLLAWLLSGIGIVVVGLLKKPDAIQACPFCNEILPDQDANACPHCQRRLQ